MAPQPGFVEAVNSVIGAIPRGEVMTYGEIALEAGYPGASRAVGHLLAGGGGGGGGPELPWWRVVTASGRLVPGHERTHARRLAEEGVALNADRTRVRMGPRN
ncbi:MAG TPA: MGMT family protein [Acidimicrobiales bacterium]|jgi:methylated-DNA-protein-cysteine methyltransferase-like protein|nr:MGMT family protein [Acidimicrobiales bacterium]